LQKTIIIQVWISRFHIDQRSKIGNSIYVR